MKEGNKLSKRDSFKYRISKTELPSAKSIKQINIQFLMNAKKGVRDSNGEKTVYHLHSKSYNQMQKYIMNIPNEDINRIMWNFHEKSNLFHQCAYYFRAITRGQIFLDANHRTAYFSLKMILKKKGIIIDANTDYIIELTEYVKGQEWLLQTDMNLNLKEKDEEYYFLVDWFEEKLQLR